MFGSKIGKEAVNKSLGIIDKAVTDKDKKQELAAEVVQNELSSGSRFLSSARPLIIYTGLFLIVLEFFGIRLLFLSFINSTDSAISSSTQIFQFFLTTWSGIVSVYIGSRTFEKYKMRQLFKKGKN